MNPPTLTLVLRGAAATARAGAGRIAAWIEAVADLLQRRNYALQISTSRPTKGPYTTAAWQRSAVAMMGGEIQWLSLGVAPTQPPESGARVTWWWGLTHPDVAELDLSAEFEGRRPFREEEFIGLCLDAAEASGLAQGLLLPARPPRFFATRTGVEAALELEGTGLGPKALERYARGPGWGLWLTDGHLKGLGGRNRAVREAPVHRTVERPPGLWLELTPSPWDVPDHALATLEAFLTPILPSPEQARAADPPWEPRFPATGRPTEADAYADYHGPLVAYEWLSGNGDGLVLNIHLAQAPSADASAALARAVQAWYEAGVDEAYGSGGFHDFRGSNWEDWTARWDVDICSADVHVKAAVNDLMRRLAGWSVRWNCPIAAVRVGVEAP